MAIITFNIFFPRNPLSVSGVPLTQIAALRLADEMAKKATGNSKPAAAAAAAKHRNRKIDCPVSFFFLHAFALLVAIIAGHLLSKKVV